MITDKHIGETALRRRRWRQGLKSLQLTGGEALNALRANQVVSITRPIRLECSLGVVLINALEAEFEAMRAEHIARTIRGLEPEPPDYSACWRIVLEQARLGISDEQQNELARALIELLSTQARSPTIAGEASTEWLDEYAAVIGDYTAGVTMSSIFGEASGISNVAASLRSNAGEALYDFFNAAPRREILEPALLAFSRNRLVLHWLEESRGSQGFHEIARLLSNRFEVSTMRIQSQIESIGRQLDNTGAARRILGRLQESLTQTYTYADIVREILDAAEYQSSQTLSGPNSIVGASSPINVIPATDEGGVCCDTVLALAQGTSGKTAFKKVIKGLNKHLIRCKKTTLAILITDRWDPREFEEEFEYLDEHVAHGLAFVPVVVFRGELHLLNY